MCPQNDQAQFTTLDDLIGLDLTDAAFIFINRESTVKQETHHRPKVKELQEAHSILKIKEQFAYELHNGSALIMDDLLCNPNLEYFGWLRKIIQEGLDKTPPGNNGLYIVVCTIDRLIRPQRYKGNNPCTWELTEADMELFHRWLHLCFGERVRDITFVLIHDVNAGKARSIQTKLGMQQKGKMGGRPRTINWRDEAIRLAYVENKNAGEILRIFESRQSKNLVKVRRIQQWLNEAGLNKKPGRPKGTCKK